MRIQLRSRVDGVARRKGASVTRDDVAVLLRENADVYKPDGQPLILLRKRAYAQELLDANRSILAHVASKYRSDNRAAYAGAARATKTFGDGTKSKNSRTVTKDGKHLAVESAIVGYFDRQGGRFPFCRSTAFTAKEVESWATVVPLAQATAGILQTELPGRYAAQMAIAQKTPREYIVDGTPFTTLTVNRNVVGRIHQDKGDYAPGFGCLCVLRSGTYGGGWLVFPEYRVGVDLEDGDMVLFSPHDWHGVTDFEHTEPGFQRISVVFYYREKMHECLPPKEELKRLHAKQAVLR